MRLGARATLAGRPLLKIVLRLLGRWAIVRRGRLLPFSRMWLPLTRVSFLCQVHRRCHHHCHFPPCYDMALEMDRGRRGAAVSRLALGFHLPCCIDGYHQPFRLSAPVPRNSPPATADRHLHLHHCLCAPPPSPLSPAAASSLLSKVPVSSVGRISPSSPSSPTLRLV